MAASRSLVTRLISFETGWINQPGNCLLVAVGNGA
jgi:hypothetical protein